MWAWPMDVGGPEALRMVGVAFDLGGTALVALDEDAPGEAVVGHRRGVEERPTQDQAFGLLHVGQDLLGRLLGAGGEARERQRRAHEGQELAPALGVFEDRGLLGKLPVQELEEARGSRPAPRGSSSSGGRGRPPGGAARRRARRRRWEPRPRSSVARRAGGAGLDLVFLHQPAARARAGRPGARRRCCRPRTGAARTSPAGGGSRGTTPSGATSPARRAASCPRGRGRWRSPRPCSRARCG